MKRIALVALFASMAILPAAAQHAAGDWKVVGTIGDNPISLDCSIKEADKKLSGECKDAMFPKLVVTGETDGKTLKWSYDVDFQGQKMTVEYAGTVESATSSKGNISVMGQQMGAFTATKK